MDYLSDSFNSKKKPLAGVTNAIQGELVTPTPANYTKPKALPNETFIEGQKASTNVGRPNPQIGQTQQALPKPNNVLNGDLFAQNPATFKPATTVQNTIIDGQVSRPLVGTQPTISAVNPVNSGTTQSLTQMAQKPALPPYQPAKNPVNQYGAIPPQTGNVGGSVSPTPPAQSITTRLAGTVSKLAAATPAIQAGMNASNIMNQEANFAKNIHAGSIAAPNFGKEVLGDTANQFSRTQTPAPKLSTGVIGVGRAGTQPVPDQYINSRAGQSLNPAYTQYAANHPQKPAVAPANQATQPLRDVKVPAFSTPTNPVANVNPMDSKPAPQQYAPKLTGTQPAMPTSMNDVTSGTGFIKGGNGAFKDGVGFTQEQGGVLSLSNGKTIDPNQPTYHTADGKGTITSNARPSMHGLSTQADIDVLDKLSAQRESGAITAAQASQIYAQYKQDTSPLAQQPQIAMQRMAAHGNIQAAQQLTQEAQQQALGQYQQGTLANQKSQQDALNEQTQYARNTPTQQFENEKANLQRQALVGSKEARQKLTAFETPKLEKISTSTTDTAGNKYATERLVNPNRETTLDDIKAFSAAGRVPEPAIAEPKNKKGLLEILFSNDEQPASDSPYQEGTTGTYEGKRVKIVNGQPVPI